MRLIDADALKELIDVKGANIGITNANRCNFKDMLKMVPTVDAEPVRHGHWVKPGGYVCGDYEFVCSVCGDCRWEGLGLPNRAHYCQCCGAKMDEVSE